MKKYLIILLCLACLVFSACGALPQETKATPEPEATEERPPAPEFSLCLYLDDGNTRRLPLTTEANEALRDLIETAEPCLDNAEGSADLIFVNDETTIFLNSAKALLTVVSSETEQGVTYKKQSNYHLTAALDPKLLPEWEEPQEKKKDIVTLQDLIAAADTSLLDEEGVLLETVSYEGSFPAAAANRCAAVLNGDGTLILRARKLDLTGAYETMTIQEARLVGETLIVSAAVLSEEGSAVSVELPSEVRQIWFMETGAFMDILTFEPAE